MRWLLALLLAGCSTTVSLDQRPAQPRVLFGPAVPRPVPSVASRSRTTLPRSPSEVWADRADVRALRLCESGDRLHAVSPTGKYAGLYQSTASWAHGSREEQNRGAWLLWLKHGAAPWPHCGRVLR